MRTHYLLNLAANFYIYPDMKRTQARKREQERLHREYV